MLVLQCISMEKIQPFKLGCKGLLGTKACEQKSDCYVYFLNFWHFTCLCCVYICMFAINGLTDRWQLAAVMASMLPQSSRRKATNYSILNLTLTMGARRGARGGTCPPPGVWKNDVICCRPTKYPKFFGRAFGARHRYSIFQSKTARKTQKFSFCALVCQLF